MPAAVQAQDEAEVYLKKSSGPPGEFIVTIWNVMAKVIIMMTKTSGIH